MFSSPVLFIYTYVLMSAGAFVRPYISQRDIVEVSGVNQFLGYVGWGSKNATSYVDRFWRLYWDTPISRLNKIFYPEKKLFVDDTMPSLSSQIIICARVTAAPVLFISLIRALKGSVDEQDCNCFLEYFFRAKIYTDIANAEYVALYKPTAVIAALMLIPWRRIAKIIRAIGNIGLSAWVGFILFIVAYTGFAVLLVTFPILAAIIFIPAVLALLFVVFKILSLTVAEWREDRVTFQLITQVFLPERPIIAANFKALRTEGMRFRYVSWVGAKAGDHLKRLQDPSNRWPDDQRPNQKDAASTILAQLDARWMKLDI